MCGIGLVWAKESVPTFRQLDILMLGAEKRGQNGFGVCLLDEKMRCQWQGKFNSYEEGRGRIYLKVQRSLMVGGFLLFSSRATPETESPTSADKNNVQPIVYPIKKSIELMGVRDSSVVPVANYEIDSTHHLYLAHNGGVTDSIAKQYFEGFQRITTLDSEAIIAAYIAEKNNMQNVMEKLSGSFAFILLDNIKQCVYAVTGFNPLAHMYIKGVGYFLHSDLDVLKVVLYQETGVVHDGMNVWESWYHHYIEGYTIIETDVQSGFQRKHTYKPNFMHPTWNKTMPASTRKKAIVVASGGVDSGVTAMLLKEAEYDVELLHFDYGQRAEKCERWACEQIANHLKVPCNTVDLTQLYEGMKDTSFLLNDSIEGGLTGGDLIKSTVAWVPGRNAIFATIAMAVAEGAILEAQYGQAFIAAGWNQLSEETGGYPDNSFQFNQVLESLKLYGYITGSRIKFLPVLQRLTKTETWFLASKFNFPFNLTVSCDTPQWDTYLNMPKLCPECGSTKLSIIAADRAGVADRRLFTRERPTLGEKMQMPLAINLLSRLALDPKAIQTLKLKLLAMQVVQEEAV